MDDRTETEDDALERLHELMAALASSRTVTDAAGDRWRSVVEVEACEGGPWLVIDEASVTANGLAVVCDGVELQYIGDHVPRWRRGGWARVRAKVA